MAYSGTISETVFTTRQVIEAAVRRCQLQPSVLTGESVQIANTNLYLLLSDLANQGAPLWCIERQVYPLYEGVADIVLDKGTVDILNGNMRRVQQLQGANDTTANSYEVSFESPTTVAVVGVKWNGQAVPLIFEGSDTGHDWDWHGIGGVYSPKPSQSIAPGQWDWWDVSVIMPYPFFRVSTADPLAPLVYQYIVLGGAPTEIPLARLNRDDFTSLPNKTFRSNQPLQYWFDRQARQPVMHLWPVPNAAAEISQLVLWRQRHIMDVGPMQGEIEVPQRWYEAIVAMLAPKLALELPEADNAIIPMLDAKAAQALNVAQAEERDNSPIYMAPNISPYTR